MNKESVKSHILNNNLALYIPYNNDFIFSKYFLGTNQKFKYSFMHKDVHCCPVYDKEWLNKLEYVMDSYSVCYAQG